MQWYQHEQQLVSNMSLISIQSSIMNIKPILPWIWRRCSFREAVFSRFLWIALCIMVSFPIRMMVFPFKDIRICCICLEMTLSAPLNETLWISLRTLMTQGSCGSGGLKIWDITSVMRPSWYKIHKLVYFCKILNILIPDFFLLHLSKTAGISSHLPALQSRAFLLPLPIAVPWDSTQSFVPEEVGKHYRSE